MLKTFWTILVFSGAAAAQPVGAGVKVGAPLTDAFKIQPFPSLVAFGAEAPRYTVGPYVELRLPANMAIEVDALYRPYDFSIATGGATAQSWEFPVVLKHKLLRGPVKPYFEGGLSFSHLSDVCCIAVNHLSNYGVVAGGGVELNLLLLKISPEIRYTGWGFRNFDSLVQSNRNQVAFLVGFGF